MSNHINGNNIVEDENVEDVNVCGVKPLIPPAILQDELPLTETVKKVFYKTLHTLLLHCFFFLQKIYFLSSYFSNMLFL